jgi:hypothetical protein
MPTPSPRFSSLRSSQHNYVRPMPALELQQNLRQNPIGHASIIWPIFKRCDDRSTSILLIRDMNLTMAAATAFIQFETLIGKSEKIHVIEQCH